MEVDLIFKIAGVGLLVSALYQVLEHSGRKEQAMLTTLAGLVVVLLMVLQQVGRLFDSVKTIFRL
jgi:stage III sporulation protein AC